MLENQLDSNQQIVLKQLKVNSGEVYLRTGLILNKPNQPIL